MRALQRIAEQDGIAVDDLIAEMTEFRKQSLTV
jgi:hypothetical protein